MLLYDTSDAHIICMSLYVIPILYGFPKVPMLIMVSQKCQYRQKLGPMSKYWPLKCGTRIIKTLLIQDKIATKNYWGKEVCLYWNLFRIASINATEEYFSSLMSFCITDEILNHTLFGKNVFKNQKYNWKQWIYYIFFRKLWFYRKTRLIFVNILNLLF